MAHVNDRGDVVLNTGKIIYSTWIIGISRVGIDDNRFKLTYGYNGEINNEDDLTIEERRELADYYINMWNKWAISKPCGR